jgi:hypothetical protein
MLNVTEAETVVPNFDRARPMEFGNRIRDRRPTELLIIPEDDRISGAIAVPKFTQVDDAQDHFADAERCEQDREIDQDVAKAKPRPRSNPYRREAAATDATTRNQRHASCVEIARL